MSIRSASGDGNGWVGCSFGHRHWGRFGAAGLLITDGRCVLLQHRAPWTHEGDTWAVPGGARDSHEDPLTAARREAAEETSLDLDAIMPFTEWVDDHGGWSYWTLVLDVPHRFDAPAELSWETAEARWVADHDLGQLELFDDFRSTLERLGMLPAG